MQIGTCRGLEVTLEFDERNYIGVGLYVFASVLERFNAGDINVIVSAQVLDEGLDVPGAEIAIVVGGSASTRRYVQRIENGEANVGPDIVTGIHVALQVPYAELYQGEPEDLSDWERMRGDGKKE